MIKRFFYSTLKSFRPNHSNRKSSGFTIVEVLVDILIVSLVAIAVLSAYSASFKAVELAKAKIAAVALANEKVEELRNLSYDSLATQHGLIYPPGNILDSEDITRKGIVFTVKTVIAYVDDPFDGNATGTIQGKPKDLYPYDYKRIEVSVYKIGRSGYLAKLSSFVAAKAAETPSNSGIINLCVVDSLAVPVPGAEITITNTTLSPQVDIRTTVGDDGCVMVPNLPLDERNNYHLTATKFGFSNDSTYPRTDQNPNALFPDVNVMIQQVTNQTLVIDRLSSLTLEIYDQNDQLMANTSVHLEGTKEIYFNPHTPKYSQELVTDSFGKIELNNMEFDDYVVSSPDRYVFSVTPYQPFTLHANSTLVAKVYTTTSNSSPRISKAEPIHGKVNETVSMMVLGDKFNQSATIKLKHSTSDAEIIGQNTQVTAGNTIEADFNLTGAEIGNWNIIITNPDGECARQYNGFTII